LPVLTTSFTPTPSRVEPGRWDLCTLFDVNYKPSDM
jgi:hypothetical protein